MANKQNRLQGLDLRLARLNVACWHIDETACRQSLEQYFEGDWHLQDAEGLRLAMIAQRFLLKHDFAECLKDGELQMEIERLRKSLNG